ncbi:hypothetical protein [Stackebrandtia nassauensis]|uniref:MFS transporter n=1 Tax=Stackebrandtia nassauensis (strain DSM 44728 / CIP 108903 / NRRL B-16338 / NBRC 102104 / LLR-40K-21) TaxID=446470 RepID=D3Q5Q1_STANL|nr:hypothetical protein [Stackebrandtia nassauensis]ADD40200.1 hypothetical protein Snas_0485 [Stackebrandtia nassauensis DSM 44728]
MTTAPHARQRLRRVLARLALVAVAALAVLFFNPGTANAEDKSKCTVEQWHNSPKTCAAKLPKPSGQTCKEPPVPGSPDTGMAGWFAEPDLPKDSDVQGMYTKYGYGGYDLNLYGADCTGELPGGAQSGNDLANLEFTLATGIIGSANGLRQAAWEPSGMWGWADNFVEKASSAIYEKVFSVFGAITIGLVGLYLLWRSRQADMSMAVTTAGWAVLVLVVVTAVAAYPTESAKYADSALTGSLNVIQDAVGPPAEEDCPGNEDCDDTRAPALRASDMATGEILYNNWVRSVFGQSPEVEYAGNNKKKVTDYNSAYKYGPALYDAQAFSWKEINDLRKAKPEEREGMRKDMVDDKKDQWRKVTALIEKEDPEVYYNITGANGWDRVGTGFLALLSAIFFALFDITASILIILGFLIIRWAVVALPLIGTIAMLRPASAGFKRLISAVLAAVINVIVFGVAAAVYLFAVSQILAASLPGWLQVLLIGLIGAVAWMLLRPYRRIGSLRGGTSLSDAAFGRKSKVEVEQKVVIKKDGRPEDQSDEVESSIDTNTKEPLMAGAKGSRSNAGRAEGDASKGLPPRPTPGRSAPESGSGSEARPGYAVYRPSSSGTGQQAGDRPLVAVRPD